VELKRAPLGTVTAGGGAFNWGGLGDVSDRGN